jgi:hypothetical protein
MLQENEPSNTRWFGWIEVHAHAVAAARVRIEPCFEYNVLMSAQHDGLPSPFSRISLLAMILRFTLRR